MKEEPQEKLNDKPKDMPMPVPSIGVEKPKAKEPAKSQSKINHDSDQPDSRATPTQTGQIDAEESPTVSTSSDTSVSPPSLGESLDSNSSEAPTLPFDEGDLMSKQATPKPNVPATRHTSPPAVAGGPTDMELDRQIEDKKAENWLTKRGDSYKVHGKERPDAASIQRVSNNKGVCTEVLSAIQTNEYAEAIVRAHLGSIYVDAVVHHCFENYRRLLVLEMVNKNPDVLDCWKGEMPVIKLGATIKDASGKIKDAQYSIMHSYFSFIQFALRDATTKAEAAAQAKILNQEFREKEDIESEQFEADLVKQSKRL